MAAVLDDLLATLAATPLVSVAALHKRHGHREVLRGVDLELRRGEVVALLGRGGAGKSTLLRCIAGLEGFHDGTLSLQGRPPPQPGTWRRAVGWVFQGLHLPPDIGLGWHLMQSAALADRPNAAALAHELLARVGLAELFDALPGGLTAAQRQRAALAHALAPGPTVLLCDDLTSADDPEQAGEVGAAARALASDGLALLLATHDPALARHADRIVFLHDGRVLESGPPAELLARPQTPELKRLLATQRPAPHRRSAWSAAPA
ncbi:ATP-binding cassette domain-containing protein [Roseateles sp. BYS78W]|uniref:ATP-binding cassette domain-containing protein n=1 Tax=Pelomonas candidula TaxID=3299025 RepID=A0ABW7HE83_9BURK